MQYLLAEVASIVLLYSFIVFVSYEKRAGRLFLASIRSTLDRKIERILYVFHHVDMLSFLKDTVQSLFGNSLHIIARTALLVVRFVEKHLNDLVYKLHIKFSMHNAPSGHPSVPSKSPFIQSISGYKKELKKRKKPPELSS